MDWKQDQSVSALPMDVRGELEDTPTAERCVLKNKFLPILAICSLYKYRALCGVLILLSLYLKVLNFKFEFKIFSEVILRNKQGTHDA